MKQAFLVAFGSIFALSADVYAHKDGDSQVWNTDVEEFKSSF